LDGAFFTILHRVTAAELGTVVRLLRASGTERQSDKDGRQRMEDVLVSVAVALLLPVRNPHQLEARLLMMSSKPVPIFRVIGAVLDVYRSFTIMESDELLELGVYG
jgi:hypothetical protein